MFFRSGMGVGGWHSELVRSGRAPGELAREFETVGRGHTKLGRPG